MSIKLDKKEIQNLILDEVFKILKEDKIIIKNKKKISLTGKETDFDSVALIRLITSLENILEKKYKKNIIIADDKILNNIKILKDTESLLRHIYSKLNEKI